MTALPAAPAWPDLVAAHLNRGRDRAITIGALAEALGVHRSIVEHAVEAARKQGVPICSGQAGLWISDDPAEIRACADALAQRLVSQYATVRSLRATAARQRAARVVQMEMFG